MKRIALWTIGIALIGAYCGSKTFAEGNERLIRVGTGFAIGALCGALLGWIFYRLAERNRFH